MLVIKNVVKNANGDIESVLELLKRDFEEIVLECPIPEDVDVTIETTIQLNSDGTEQYRTTEKRIEGTNINEIKRGCEI